MGNMRRTPSILSVGKDGPLGSDHPNSAAYGDTITPGGLSFPARKLAQFWDKVNKKSDKECWEWTGARIGAMGYGQFQGTLAHRQSWMIHHGPIPKGMVIMHSCDNPLCVNPGHLSLGTHQENVHDMIEKNRHQLYDSPVIDIERKLPSGSDQNYVEPIRAWIEQGKVKYSIAYIKTECAEAEKGIYSVSNDETERNIVDDDSYIDWPESKDFYDTRVNK